MKLYIMRHGHAPSLGEARVESDALRPLSERGKAQARRTAEEILKRGGKPARILHSPLRRAIETAGVASLALGLEKKREVFEPLSNVLGAADLFDALMPRLIEADELLVVGHQPQLGELAALLAGQLHDLKPAGVVAVEFEKGQLRAASVWAFQPD